MQYGSKADLNELLNSRTLFWKSITSCLLLVIYFEDRIKTSPE